MGEQQVNLLMDEQQRMDFTQHLFKDILALEIMIEKGMIEKGITRIGAEQELCLIDSSFRPAPIAMEVLDAVEDPHLTNELSRFNLEINLDPQVFRKDALSRMEKQLKQCLGLLSDHLQEQDHDYVLAGILPTIRISDLDMKNLTPNPRYLALNESMRKLRGGPYEFRIEGTDELITSHDTLMFESCNTSFQVHYQLDADDFVSRYNWAQAITGPLLAACTNSPMLFGRRLWRETRIALFQQSADTRKSSEHLRDQRPRVYFGHDWVRDSIVEIFKEDVARYRVLMSSDIKQDSIAELEAGRAPKLEALKLHNGTIYKWNRACYGMTNGVPHLRIENRVLPAGPTVLDEMANTAFWLGLMHGMPQEYAKLKDTADFDEVRTNFLRAAKMGMGAMFRWVNDKVYSSQDLVLKELLPIAVEGLKKADIHKKDISKYMDVIRQRVETGRSGSQWVLDSYASLKKKGTKDEAIVAITAGMAKRQKSTKPVHKWSVAKINEAGSWINRYWRIDQIMSRDLYTVNENDLIDLVPNIMNWKHLRHVPVENEAGELVGIVTSQNLLSYYAKRFSDKEQPQTVKEIMVSKLITVNEETLTIDALPLMRKHEIGCLPVVKEGNKLVGIVTDKDFVNIADHLLREIVSKKK